MLSLKLDVHITLLKRLRVFHGRTEEAEIVDNFRELDYYKSPR